MEEIVHLIPLLLIALFADTSIILFILVPPFLFGGTFALIEWATQGFGLSHWVETLQIGMYTGTTAMMDEFAPLFLSGAAVIIARKSLRLPSWQLAMTGVVSYVAFSLIHLHLTSGHTGDIIGMVAAMNGISVWLIDHFQKRRGQIPTPPAQLFLTPDTPGDLLQVSFQSDRLDFRPITLALAQTVYECFTPEVARFLPVRPPMIPAESEQFLRETLARMRRGEEIVLAIFEADSDRFVGLCGLHAGEDAQTPELSLWLRQEAQGRGYGSEVLHALLAWGSEHLVCTRFLYPVVTHNRPACAIAEANDGTLVRTYARPTSRRPLPATALYAFAPRTPDPATVAARLTFWVTDADLGRALADERYRLVYDRALRVESRPPLALSAFAIIGRYLTIQDRRILRTHRAWVAAGEAIERLLSDPSRPLVFLGQDAALALAIARIHATVETVISIEIISAMSLDPVEPTITNRHDPIAPVATLASIPDNYYVLILAVNGRHKHIYHYRSNGERIFEDIHTMGAKTSPTLRNEEKASGAEE